MQDFLLQDLDQSFDWYKRSLKTLKTSLTTLKRHKIEKNAMYRSFKNVVETSNAKDSLFQVQKSNA